MTTQDNTSLILAEMPPQEAAVRLRAIGENDIAEALETTVSGRPKSSQEFGVFGIGDARSRKPWGQSGCVVGYFPRTQTDGETVPIISAHRIEAEPALKKTPLKITFDCFYVAEYPGASKHQVLFHFNLQNQVRGRAGADTVHFNTTCEVSNNAAAPLLSFPLFTGLRVGNEGVTFECETINVTNQRDQEILGILKSDILKNGIKLISTFQPALAPLSEIAVGLVRVLCSRNENVRVYKFQLGLDFSGLKSRGFLAEGSYVVTQLSTQLQQLWNWNDWAYHIDSGLIINKSNPQQCLPYNYSIFGISRSQEA